MLDSDEDYLAIEDFELEDSKEAVEEVFRPEVIKLSLNLVVGLTTLRTMKIKGEIGQQEVIILVDSGATHNFISLALVQKLALLVTPTMGFGVQIGTGAAKGEGTCKEVVLQMQQVTVIEIFLPLELGGIDVILGM